MHFDWEVAHRRSAERALPRLYDSVGWKGVRSPKKNSSVSDAHLVCVSIQINAIAFRLGETVSDSHLVCVSIQINAIAFRLGEIHNGDAVAHRMG